VNVGKVDLPARRTYEEITLLHDRRSFDDDDRQRARTVATVVGRFEVDRGKAAQRILHNNSVAFAHREWENPYHEHPKSKSEGDPTWVYWSAAGGCFSRTYDDLLYGGELGPQDLDIINGIESTGGGTG